MKALVLPRKWCHEMTSRTVGVWRTGGPSSDFGRSVDPISTRPADYANHITIRPTRFSDLPTAMTSKVSFVPYRPCRISSQMNVAISISHSLKDRDPQQNFQNRFTIYIVSVICLFFCHTKYFKSDISLVRYTSNAIHSGWN